MRGLVTARTRAHTARLLVLALLASLLTLVSFPNQPTPAKAATVSAGVCSPTGVSGGGVTITPSHGQVFYIDTGQGQRVNAAYVGYRVTSSANLSDVWVKLDNFGTQIVQLANPLDEAMQVGALNSGNSRAGVAYFLLKADRPTTTAQTHRVSIFNGNPASPGNEAITTCTFSFSTVKETIKASANKVLGVSSVNAGVIGGELVVTHEGATGTIGSGLSSPDKDVIWVSPASNTSWPTRAYRLKKVKIEYFDNKTANGTAGLTKNDELLLRPAINSIGGNKTPSSYRATYTFTVIATNAMGNSPESAASNPVTIRR